MIKILKKTTFCATSVLFLMITSYAQANTPSTAQSKSPNNLSVGINAIYKNSAYNIDDDVSVLPSLFYDNGELYARGRQFGGYIINDGKTEFTAYLQPSGNTFDAEDATGALTRLDDRKFSVMAGASYLYSTPIGGFRGQIATDISGRSKGTTANLSYLARFTPNNWTIYPSIGLEWVNSDYNDYYYGVSSKESAKSGIHAYSPDSTINPYLSVNGFYAINQDWDLFLGQSIKYLADEQRDSPLVDDRVDYRTTLGMLYKF